MFTDINIYPIITKQIIFRRNISCIEKNKSCYFIDFRSDLDPDPYQDETDPKHWFKWFLRIFLLQFECKSWA